MNNLVVLYGMEGRQEDRNYWEKRVAVYRDANPYYHAWQGDMAVERGDWQQALDYYREALDLLPDDASLLYATGMIHYQLDQLQLASSYLQRAMETATLRSDQQSYQLQLDHVRREMLAGI